MPDGTVESPRILVPIILLADTKCITVIARIHSSNSGHRSGLNPFLLFCLRIEVRATDHQSRIKRWIRDWNRHNDEVALLQFQFGFVIAQVRSEI